MPYPSRGDLLGTLREIAFAVPIDDGRAFESYEVFASRLRGTAREAVKKFDQAVAAEAARMEAERKAKQL